MTDPAVKHWTQRGRFHFWRYPGETRSLPGWHCTADCEGCASLQELLGLMRHAEWKAEAEVRITQPISEIAAAQDVFGRGYRVPERLRLVHSKRTMPDGHWRWTSDGRHPTLSLGVGKIGELIEAFASVSKNIGDFCVHADDQPLHGIDFETMSIWFW